MNPVKQFLTDYWISLRPQQSVIISTYFKNSILNLNHNIFGLFNSEVTENFYMESYQEQFLSDPYYGAGAGIYYYQMFKLDMSYDMYDREVYTIIGVFQAVGGFYNTLYFIMLCFHSKFSNSIFFSALIGKLYQVEAS